MPHRLIHLSRFLVLCLGLLGLAGCASGGDKEDAIEGRFITDTRPGDIRLFRFVVTLPEQPLHAITQLNQGGQVRRERHQLQTDRLAILEKVLARQPELNDYCPHGHTVLDKYAVINEVIIRGECKYKD